MSTCRPEGHGARPDPAIAVETFVRHERGRFHVDIVVAFPDGAVRRTVNDYRSRREAEIAASWIRRAADRDLDAHPRGHEAEHGEPGGPIHG